MGFKKLNEMYGTLKSGAPMKKGYHLPRAQMENADIARIINSTEVQSVLRPKLEAPKTFPKKRNALKNKKHKKGDDTFFKNLLKAFEKPAAAQEGEEEQD